jgi:FKBP-type peptidyl-prolyl cis-trans isomerase FkpA
VDDESFSISWRSRLKNPILFLIAAALCAACSTAPERTAAPAATVAAAAPRASQCVPAPTSLLKTDIEEGKGEPIVTRTAVLVSYTGWLYDGCKPDLKGTMFDTSAGRQTPFGLVVGAGRVIKGWDEGLVGMREKGKRMLVIPPHMGYGAAGAPSGSIPPNSTLVFEVEVLQILQRPAS